jgi:hypothetical protein
MNGTDCVVIEKRPQRGPKKGQLKALRSRVGEQHPSLKLEHKRNPRDYQC